MKVILCEDVPSLGHMGTTVNVANGYARNFLIPRRMAVVVDSANAKQIEHELRIIRRREDKNRVAMQAVAKELGQVSVNIKMRSGEQDKLFGSVTNAMIAEKLAEQGFNIDRRNIVLSEPIKTLGVFTVTARLAKEVTSEIKVWVEAEEVAEVVVEEVHDEIELDDDDVGSMAQVEAMMEAKRAKREKRAQRPERKEDAPEEATASEAAPAEEAAPEVETTEA